MSIDIDDEAVAARVAELDKEAETQVHGGRPTFAEAEWVALSTPEKWRRVRAELEG